ncbi:MAG TPA: nuclear transport factor 2 family protein [Kofleriaceae bacterium]|jgi:ketosteroid isomerase-like protein
MTTIEIGKQLVELARAGKNQEAMETLYASDIVSVEAGAPPGGVPESKGVAACIAKGKQFRERMDVHAATIEGPFPHGDRFAVYFRYDVTPRAGGARHEMKEVGLYTVKGGKISREEFFYAM